MRVSFFFGSFGSSLSPFWPLHLCFLPLVLARDASSLSSSSPSSFLPLIHHCFHILSTMCFDVHVLPSLLLHICVTEIIVPYLFPPRQMSCAIFLLSLTGMLYFNMHKAIFFDDLSLDSSFCLSIACPLQVSAQFQ